MDLKKQWRKWRGKINEEDFLVLLEQTPRDWFLMCNLIRRNNPYLCCPIEAVAGLYNDRNPKGAFTIGERIGLSTTLKEEIIYAADYTDYGPRENELRAKILKAVGLDQGND